MNNVTVTEFLDCKLAFYIKGAVALSGQANT